VGGLKRPRTVYVDSCGAGGRVPVILRRVGRHQILRPRQRPDAYCSVQHLPKQDLSARRRKQRGGG